MEQYKVILVDDEVEVIDVMKKKIRWDDLGFDVVGSATNGVKARGFESIDFQCSKFLCFACHCRNSPPNFADAATRLATVFSGSLRIWHARNRRRTSYFRGCHCQSINKPTIYDDIR